MLFLEGGLAKEKGAQLVSERRACYTKTIAHFKKKKKGYKVKSKEPSINMILGLVLY